MIDHTTLSNALGYCRNVDRISEATYQKALAYLDSLQVKPDPGPCPASEPVPEPPDMWDYIAERVHLDRNVCKVVLIGMMYGLEVMPQIVKYGVRHDEVVEMRMAFDDYVHLYKEKKNG